MTLSATAAGGLPARTRSKCRRARRVLALEEEGAGELEADARQVRPVDQDGPEGGDGLVQKHIAGLAVGRDVSGGERRHAGAEAQAGRTFRAPCGG